MDNLCHTLAGAAFGEAGLKHRTRFGNATLMIAANLPDVDVLVFATDVPAMAFRRGWTHGPIALALLPVALAAAMMVATRTKTAKPDGPPARLGWLLVLGYVGVLSHVGLDLLNSYGLRLWAPFDWQWLYGDTLFIIDPWLWLAFGAGIWLARRRGSPIAARRGLWAAALYITVMVIAARSVRTFVTDTWRSAHGREPHAVMANPRPVDPFTRDVVIDAGEHYEVGTFRWLPRRVSFEPAIVPKNDEDTRAVRAAAVPNVRGYLVWSRFPFWTFAPVPGGTRVTVSDMRFAGQTPARLETWTVVPD